MLWWYPRLFSYLYDLIFYYKQNQFIVNVKNIDHLNKMQNKIADKLESWSSTIVAVISWDDDYYYISFNFYIFYYHLFIT